jgi:hypothetical protein
LRPLDVLPLRALVAAAQQDHDLRPAMYVIDAVAGTISDAHFHHAATDAPGITRISQLHTSDAGDDPCDGIDILHAMQPVRKLYRLAHLDHRHYVVYGLQLVKPQQADAA